MMSVLFLENNDSTDPFYQQNMRVGICSVCSRNAHCTKAEQYPVISKLSRYLIRWSRQMEFMPQYPNPGTWEDQPLWFSDMIGKIQSESAKAREDKMKRKNAK